MLSLPVEVVCGGILPHLSVCDLRALDTAFTNKYLRPQLRQVWKSYQYDSLDVVLEEDEVGWLFRSDARLISLTVDNRSALEFVLTNIQTLKRLHIDELFRYNILQSLAPICPDLEELYVNYVCGSDADDSVSALAQNCRQLHTLRMPKIDQLTDAGLSSLARYGNKLHTFCVGGAPISDAGIQALCDNCPHLKHIELTYCYYLTDASLIAIAHSYPQLQSIGLRSYNFTDDGLICFANMCHELRSVSIECKNITSRGLTALWAANPKLMDVDIYHDILSDDDIIQLAQCCPLLQNLTICRCKHVTDAAVIAVAEHCPQLRSLDISECSEVSDASLIALGQHCHQLKSIDISYLRNISDVGIAALVADCPLLQEFSAYYTNITDAGVIALARLCRDLRCIRINSCMSVGVAGVSAIAGNCPLMSELDLSRCKVDDACLYVIAQHCRNLTALDVGSYRLSDVAAVRSVITSCRFLRVFRCYDSNMARLQQHISPRLLHVFKKY